MCWFICHLHLNLFQTSDLVWQKWSSQWAQGMCWFVHNNLAILVDVLLGLNETLSLISRQNRCFELAGSCCQGIYGLVMGYSSIINMEGCLWDQTVWQGRPDQGRDARKRNKVIPESRDVQTPLLVSTDIVGWSDLLRQVIPTPTHTSHISLMSCTSYNHPYYTTCTCRLHPVSYTHLTLPTIYSV